MKRTSKTVQRMFLGLAALIVLAVSGCGGGGGGVPAAQDAADVSGVISGTLETDTLTGAARAAGAQSARTVQGAQVYAFPENTPDEELIPTGAVPSAVTDAQGRFIITGVPSGNHTLVVDVDADGAADGMIPGIAVQKQKTTECGTHKAEQLQAPPENAGGKNRKGTWCDVSLDKVIYATGETLEITLQGKNETSADRTCGVLITLRKGKEHPEQWRSDFADAATFVTIPANSDGSGIIYKIIPEEWALTNTNKGSDYQVFPILADGTLWEKGKKDNFNILKEKPCATDDDSTCGTETDDGGDVVNPGADDDGTDPAAGDDGAVTPPDDNVQPGDDGTVTDPATGDDGGVVPGDDGTITDPAAGDDGAVTPPDDNVQPGDDGAATDPGTGDDGTASCNAPVACNADADCDDGNRYSIDMCMNPGTCEAWCLQGDG